jgi:hypothetical protein
VGRTTLRVMLDDSCDLLRSAQDGDGFLDVTARCGRWGGLPRCLHVKSQLALGTACRWRGGRT